MGWITKGGKHILIGEDGGSSGGGGGGGGSSTGGGGSTENVVLVKNFTEMSDAKKYTINVKTDANADEKESLSFYVNTDSSGGAELPYKEINNYYRNGVKPSNGKLYKEDNVENIFDVRDFDKVTADLDSLFSKNKTPDTVVTYRNLVIPTNESDQLVKGMSFKDPGYSSTTLNKGVAERFGSDVPVPSTHTKIVAKIVVPKGSKGIYTDSVLSKNYADEVELILDRGTNFYVKDRTVGSNGVVNLFLVVNEEDDE